MITPLAIMKLVPKAKILIALLKDAMSEYEQNIKKYGIKPNDTKEYKKLKDEIQLIMDKKDK